MKVLIDQTKTEPEIKGNNNLTLILVLLIAAAIAGYAWYQSKQTKE
jgi:predicted negative regulator of RcsB-dependent stress response